jgi:hypothetical protein
VRAGRLPMCHHGLLRQTRATAETRIAIIARSREALDAERLDSKATGTTRRPLMARSLAAAATTLSYKMLE